MRVQPLDVECETCGAAAGQPCHGKAQVHRPRVRQAEAANAAEHSGELVQGWVVAVPHPHAELDVANWDCSWCGSSHWAVWPRTHGLVLRKPPCRLTRAKRPERFWLRPVNRVQEQVP